MTSGSVHLIMQKHESIWHLRIDKIYLHRKQNKATIYKLKTPSFKTSYFNSANLFKVESSPLFQDGRIILPNSIEFLKNYYLQTWLVQMSVMNQVCRKQFYHKKLRNNKKKFFITLFNVSYFLSFLLPLKSNLREIRSSVELWALFIIFK